MKIALVGDIVLSHKYDMISDTEKLSIFNKVTKLIYRDEILFANLETVLSDTPHENKSKIILQSHPIYSKALNNLGVNIVSLGNNHTFDLGIEGYNDTLSALNKVNIKAVGSGCNKSKAIEPVYYNAGQKIIGFLAYTCNSTHSQLYATETSYGVAEIDENIYKHINNTKNHCDYLVLSIHWGEEHCSYPTPKQRQQARKMIECGANIIAGHHPHVLQGYEEYMNGYIFYSLGSLTLCDIKAEIIRNNKQKTYEFKMTAKHRKTAIIHCDIHENEINVKLDNLLIQENLIPVIDKRILHRKLNNFLLNIPLKLPGYQLFYKSYIYFTFSLLPKIKLVFSKKIYSLVLKKINSI